MVDMENGRSLARRKNYVIALSSGVVLAVILGSCVLSKDKSEAQSVVDEFVSALNEGDAAAAAAQTSYPNAAESAIQQMFDGLNPKDTTFDLTQFMDLGPKTGFFSVAAAWRFGEDKEWNYQVQGGVRNLSVGWRISWDPSILAPDMGSGRTVRYDRTDAAPPRVFDATGALLLNEQTINAITLDPATMPDPVATTRRLEEVLEPVAPLVTSDMMMAELAADPHEQVTAVLLRDQDYLYLEEDLNIPGVIVIKTPKLITADRRITTPLLDPLRNVWQANRDVTAGWAVHLVDPRGTLIPQAGFQGPPGPDIHATIDSHIQLASEEAVVSVGTPAAIVLIQPSTGAVLAAAQNNQAMEEGSIAFEGLYPAGSNLDLVKKAAALQKGVDPSSLSIEEVDKAGNQLGLGMNWKVPGLDHQTAAFTAEQSGVSKVMNRKSSDLPAVTPFGMAMVAASIARGSAPTPVIVHGQPGSTEVEAEPLPAHVNDQLRGIMRDSVVRGGASYLKGHPDLLAMSGVSGDDRWVYGSRGDLAFAIFVADADGGDRAIKMTDKLFREMAKPPN
ncbi:NTF2-like N-terminal transpeptidase domain-containing protein [Rhodococcus marinonascens]|uniref:NTF2-like N-terminal transpeptidase domain-containing protein n=1 Tax=Rhodococcus marinonascens TaxID=38311 RepID=UPI000A00DED4|nr:NTF2-like N-terminal transpeptidase domain-containing protein [Rhodococcus marinonascens]